MMYKIMLFAIIIIAIILLVKLIIPIIRDYKYFGFALPKAIGLKILDVISLIWAGFFYFITPIIGFLEETYILYYTLQILFPQKGIGSILIISIIVPLLLNFTEFKISDSAFDGFLQRLEIPIHIIFLVKLFIAISGLYEIPSYYAENSVYHANALRMILAIIVTILTLPLIIDEIKGNSKNIRYDYTTTFKYMYEKTSKDHFEKLPNNSELLEIARDKYFKKHVKSEEQQFEFKKIQELSPFHQMMIYSGQYSYSKYLAYNAKKKQEEEEKEEEKNKEEQERQKYIDTLVESGCSREYAEKRVDSLKKYGTDGIQRQIEYEINTKEKIRKNQEMDELYQKNWDSAMRFILFGEKDEFWI